jgi:DNA invertase Pin-like site-specific DNA recombinase
MAPSVEKLRTALHLAAAAGVPAPALEAAARELVRLLDAMAIEPDARKVATRRKAMRIRQALEAGAEPAAVRERFGLSKTTFYRLLQQSHDSRDSDPAESSAVT